MKFFISYKFSGENRAELEKTLRHICDLIDSKGHKSYCSFWDKDFFAYKNYSQKQILTHAFRELNKCKWVVIFVKSNEKSEGMLLEAGYALAKKKKILLIIKKGVQINYLKEFANKIIEFENLEQLN
jgi:nucleoside 2-deoxyribosyltransferase